MTLEGNLQGSDDGETQSEVSMNNLDEDYLPKNDNKMNSDEENE